MDFNIGERTLGCWLGKAAGGTLGMPYEGHDGPFDLKYYCPVPKTMLPNDDLDLQVLWACVMDKMDTPKVDKNILGDAWVKHVGFPWDEYGVCIRNLRKGIRPPFSGIVDNWFYNGMGAAIRSELWACLAPGRPSLAATYAYEDACVDHSGDGIWAEVFIAALESLCFRNQDLTRIVVEAAAYLPLDSKVRSVSLDTLSWWSLSHDWGKVRSMILDKYEHQNFTDTIQNIGFIILGLLAGEGDFGRTICSSVNCGKDTDCTGATAGAIFGIMHPDRIGEKWISPIGESLVVSKEITGISAPETLCAFNEIVTSLRERLDNNCGHSEFEPDIIEVGLSFLPPDSFLNGSFAISETIPGGVPDEREQRLFPGNCGYITVEEHCGRVASLEYRFKSEDSKPAKVMLCSESDCAVFLDGIRIFGGCGQMAPSFHRAGAENYAEVKLSIGEHVLAAFIKASPDDDLRWVLGIGGNASNQWLSYI